MTDEKTYVDITDGKNREVALSDIDMFQIRENPSGLTREGCEQKIFKWKDYNPILYVKYKTMLEVCKNFASSGTTANGEIILQKMPARKLAPRGGTGELDSTKPIKIISVPVNKILKG